MRAGISRRRFGGALVAIAAAISAPLKVFARSEAAFAARASDAALRDLYGDRPIVTSDLIDLKMPDIAEDGSIVPVTVSTSIPEVRAITLLVDQNPNPLSARFFFQPAAAAEFKTRIKMGESSDVRAVVETADALFLAVKNVKVTLGGCGG